MRFFYFLLIQCDFFSALPLGQFGSYCLEEIYGRFSPRRSSPLDRFEASKFQNKLTKSSAASKFIEAESEFEKVFNFVTPKRKRVQPKKLSSKKLELKSIRAKLEIDKLYVSLTKKSVKNVKVEENKKVLALSAPFVQKNLPESVYEKEVPFIPKGYFIIQGCLLYTSPSPRDS